MLPIIIEAALNFCKHQLQLPFGPLVECIEKRTKIAYIDVEHLGKERYRIFIGCDDLLIQTIAEIFLGETQSDSETLRDMLLETANMIVGSAKVLAQEIYNEGLSITTPSIYNDYAVFEEEHYLTIQNGTMFIGLQRL